MITIQYQYKEEWYNFDITNKDDYLYSLIQDIIPSENRINYPNDEFNMQIRDIVENYVRKQSYYIEGVLA